MYDGGARVGVGVGVVGEWQRVGVCVDVGEWEFDWELRESGSGCES